jgi:hypothetical protein
VSQGGRALIRWARLEEGRRRAHRRGPAGWPPAVSALLGGGALAGWIGAGGEGTAGARLLVAATALALLVLCGAPFRLFWRRDSALLARLPLRGRALVALALVRTLGATGLAALALAPALAALAWVGGDAVRHGAIVLALLALGGGGGLGAAVAAGAIVASDQVQRALAGVAGELAAPGVVWLGALPAFAGAAAILFALDLAPWAVGEPIPVGEPWVLIGLALGVGVAGPIAAHAAADRVMPGALREVSALDRERLAHVDRSTPSPLERAWARLALRTPGAARVFAKDAALTRRRHPSPYALGPLAVVAAWLLPLAGEGGRGWAIGLVGALGAYAALIARRGLAPPIELPALGATLPIAPSDLAAAKRAAAVLRVVTWVGLAGTPLLVARPGVGLAAWIAVAGGAAIVAAAPARATSPRRS